jgi:hypothetical protein
MPYPALDAVMDEFAVASNWRRRHGPAAMSSLDKFACDKLGQRERDNLHRTIVETPHAW